MSGASIRYEGDKHLFKVLDRVADPAERTMLMEAIGAFGVSDTQQRFLDQEGPDGAKWVPSRRAESTGGITLSKTRRLFSSFAFQATATMVAWGTNVIYAGIHHFGGIIRAKNAAFLQFRGQNGGFTRVKQVTIPARPYLGINAHGERRIHQLAEQWLEEIAR